MNTNINSQKGNSQNYKRSIKKEKIFKLTIKQRYCQRSQTGKLKEKNENTYKNIVKKKQFYRK